MGRRQLSIRDHQQGFTLIEMMIAIAIIAVVVGVTIMGVGRLGEHQRFLQRSQTVKALLVFARNEAILQQTPVAVDFKKHQLSLRRSAQGHWQDWPVVMAARISDSSLSFVLQCHEKEPRSRCSSIAFSPVGALMIPRGGKAVVLQVKQGAYHQSWIIDASGYSHLSPLKREGA